MREKDNSCYKFTIVIPSKTVWNVIENTYDSTVYKTHQWLDYINKQGWQTIIVRIEQKDECIGYFVGEIIKRGITIVASPFEGIGTGHQGLSMLSQVTSKERLNIYNELALWIFKNGLSSFIQIEDWQLSMEDVSKSEFYSFEPHRVKYVDLTLSEDQLFGNLHKDCKYSLRKAKNNGLIVRETVNSDTFIDIFFAQLEDVFDKKGLRPTRNKNNVKKLIESIWPDDAMLLEVVTKEGIVAATAIIIIHGNYSATWQTASFREYQNLRPNEILRWEAMLKCKRRGATMINFCGTQGWKDKFGATLTHTPRLYYCKYPVLLKFKHFAKFSYYSSRNILSSFKKHLRRNLYYVHDK